MISVPVLLAPPSPVALGVQWIQSLPPGEKSRLWSVRSRHSPAHGSVGDPKQAGNALPAASAPPAKAALLAAAPACASVPGALVPDYATLLSVMVKRFARLKERDLRLLSALDPVNAGDALVRSESPQTHLLDQFARARDPALVLLDPQGPSLSPPFPKCADVKARSGSRLGGKSLLGGFGAAHASISGDPSLDVGSDAVPCRTYWSDDRGAWCVDLLDLLLLIDCIHHPANSSRSSIAELTGKFSVARDICIGECWDDPPPAVTLVGIAWPDLTREVVLVTEAQVVAVLASAFRFSSFPPHSPPPALLPTLLKLPAPPTSALQPTASKSLATPASVLQPTTSKTPSPQAPASTSAPSRAPPSQTPPTPAPGSNGSGFGRSSVQQAIPFHLAKAAQAGPIPFHLAKAAQLGAAYPQLTTAQPLALGPVSQSMSQSTSQSMSRSMSQSMGGGAGGGAPHLPPFFGARDPAGIL